MNCRFDLIYFYDLLTYLETIMAKVVYVWYQTEAYEVYV
jgi:hypothetical protein